TRGIANALIGAALAAGWLAASPDDANVLVLSVSEPPTEPTLAQFYQQLRAYKEAKLGVEAVRGAATRVAGSIGRDVVRALEAGGLLRSKETVGRLRAIVLGTGGLVLAVGVIRTARGVSLNRPVTLLVWEMIAVVIVTLLLSRRSLGSSTLKDEYLS